MTQTLHRFDLAGQAYKADPFPTLAALRAAGPLVANRFPLIGRVSLVTTHAGCETLLKSPDRFSVDVSGAGASRIATILRFLPANLKLLRDSMLQKDDPEHRRLRKLVDATFRHGEIDAWRPRIEAIADRLLDDLAASHDRDLVTRVARNLPLAVICEMLGLPREDRPKFTGWMASMSEINSVWGLIRMLPVLATMIGYMRARFAERRAEPRRDLISALVHAEDGGDRFTEDELLSMCFLLFVAGHETTTHLISGGVLALLQNPGELERLRAEPRLAASAVEELLRYVSPVQFTKPRFATADGELEGVPVVRGQTIMALLASANADPGVFDKPESMDIGRQRNRHLAFGGGPHFCLGAWLARTEMEVLLQRLLDRAPGLGLAIPESGLRWTRRVGIRALRSLPLRL
jgi:cytochrome P450